MPAFEHPTFLQNPSRPVFYNALRITLGRTPLWVCAGFVTLLLGAVAALPTFAWFQSALGHRYLPGALIRGLDETFRFDQRAGRAALDDTTRSAGAVLALIAMLLGAFTAGGWLQVFLERTHGQSVRRFFYGGSRFFFRFLRVLGLSLLLLQLAGWICYGDPWDLLVDRMLFGVSDGKLETLTSELTARRIGWAQDGLYLAFVALILMWGTYTRSRLALHDTNSAVWAGLCSFALVFAHPLRVLRPMVLLLAAQAGVLAIAAVLKDIFEGQLGSAGDWMPVLLLFLLTVLAIFWRSMVRGASYHVALQVSAQLIRPLARPDPWKQSLGGPGGPRYPLGGDEYGESL
jgi:hypothetical protein